MNHIEVLMEHKYIDVVCPLRIPPRIVHYTYLKNPPPESPETSREGRQLYC